MKTFGVTNGLLTVIAIALCGLLEQSITEPKAVQAQTSPVPVTNYAGGEFKVGPMVGGFPIKVLNDTVSGLPIRVESLGGLLDIRGLPIRLIEGDMRGLPIRVVEGIQIPEPVAISVDTSSIFVIRGDTVYVLRKTNLDLIAKRALPDLYFK